MSLIATRGAFYIFYYILSIYSNSNNKIKFAIIYYIKNSYFFVLFFFFLRYILLLISSILCILKISQNQKINHHLNKITKTI